MYSVRRVLTCLGLVAAGWAVAPALAAAPPAELKGFSCQTSRDPASRQVSITAVMRPRPGTRHMELKFELLRKTTGRFHRVHARGLDTWVHPNPPDLGQRPGDNWTVGKPVLDLPAPAIYRFKVIFRWDLATGRIDTALYSPSCAQT
jgi:hypothetical protein